MNCLIFELYTASSSHASILHLGESRVHFFQCTSDGVVSYQDKLIFWDNKSKEKEVNLKDHLSQFDGYICNADKKVGVFLVIGPAFTDESSVIAMQYLVENGTTIALITAAELKSLAEEWAGQKGGSADAPFPLGYLIQPGRFKRNLMPAIK